jgi:hypothetical protein
MAVRISLRPNGAEAGVVAKLPDECAKLLLIANSKLPGVTDAPFSRLFLASGDELDDDTLDLVAQNEVVYVSRGEPFLSPHALEALMPRDSAPAAGGAIETSVHNSAASSTSAPSPGDCADLALAPACVHAPSAAPKAHSSRRQLVIMLSVLAHQLQRERGASCAWVASGGSLPSFAELILSTHPAIDATLRAIRGCDVEDNTAERVLGQLMAARRAVRAAAPLPGSGTSSREQSAHGGESSVLEHGARALEHGALAALAGINFAATSMHRLQPCTKAQESLRGDMATQVRAPLSNSADCR